jgi:hypothetical protein
VVIDCPTSENDPELENLSPDIPARVIEAFRTELISRLV